LVTELKNDETYYILKISLSFREDQKTSMYAFPTDNIKRIYYCTFDLKVCKEQNLNSLGSNMLPYRI